VFAIDPHENFVGPFGGRFGPMDCGHFMQRMLELGLFHVVRPVSISSEFTADRWPMPVGLLWIDGDHQYDAVARDFRHWKNKLAADAHLLINNASDPGSGPGRLVSEIAAVGDLSVVEVRGNVAWLTRRESA
jgi:hypothetical protein